jgi:hypothetical protein
MTLSTTTQSKMTESIIAVSIMTMSITIVIKMTA